MLHYLRLHPIFCHSRDVWGLLLRAAAFVAIPVVAYLLFVFFYGDAFVEQVWGMNTESLVRKSFANAESRDFDLLIMGNSRMFRLNPDQFPMSAYNFSQLNDTYNQAYYKIKWLHDRGKKFKYLLLGTDFFQFGFLSDTRNYAYASFFDDAYFDDYGKTRAEFARPASSPGYRLLDTEFALATRRKFLFQSADAKTASLQENGQYRNYGTPSPQDAVERNVDRLEIQIRYFEKILQECERHGVKVIFCMLPIRKQEANAYAKGQMEDFRQFLAKYISEDRPLLDHTFHPGYVMEDYTDITHLHPLAADRISKELGQQLADILNQETSPRDYPEQEFPFIARQPLEADLR